MSGVSRGTNGPGPRREIDGVASCAVSGVSRGDERARSGSGRRCDNLRRSDHVAGCHGGARADVAPAGRGAGRQGIRRADHGARGGAPAGVRPGGADLLPGRQERRGPHLPRPGGGRAAARPPGRRDRRKTGRSSPPTATPSRTTRWCWPPDRSPFVPPVPGRDLTGCFVYRTIDDLDGDPGGRRARPRPASVVGGGLLGLEAANALRRLGLSTHVVEMAPRLMPVQVDEGGGAVLRAAHRGARPRPCTPARRRPARSSRARTARRRGPARRRSDASTPTWWCSPPASGPRDELARAAGLAVGERGGIAGRRRHAAPATRRSARSASAPLLDGHGLRPGRARLRDGRGRRRPARSAATATFTGADMSTKLKLLGVDVASFGDATPPTARSTSIYTDPVAGVYKKLVVTDDAQTLLGGILVGDAAAYGTLRAAVVGGAAARRAAGAARSPAAPATGTATLPDDAQVCSLQRRHQGRDLRAPSPSSGCTDVPALKACTRAGTSCGRCVPLLKQLLAESRRRGQSQGAVRALRAHPGRSCSTSSRVHGITHLRRAHRASTARGRGCDICKPAVASILASRSATGTSSTASRPRCRTPTTTSWPTSSATAPTRWCRASPAARSRRRS